MSQLEYFIGIDGGGTHCRAQLEDQMGNILGEATSGPANIVSNPQQALQSVLEAATHALANGGVTATLSEITVAAGLAGANIATAKACFVDRINKLPSPFGAFHVMSDLHAACFGAHEGQSGGLVICGTGSAATVYDHGKFEDKGGYGLMLGDNASGAWLGLEAVKHTLLVLDNIVPESTLSRNITAKLGVQTGAQMLARVAQFAPRDYGTLAPIVFSAHSHDCTYGSQLIKQGVGYLSSLIRTMTAKNRLPVCLVGGAAAHYHRLLPDDVRALISPVQANPQTGAIRYFNKGAA